MNFRKFFNEWVIPFIGYFLIGLMGLLFVGIPLYDLYHSKNNIATLLVIVLIILFFFQ